MGYFEALTANLTQLGEDGRSYYAPVGRYGPLYLVPDAQSAARLRREWRILFIAMFASIPVIVLAVGPGWLAEVGWKLWLAAPFAGLFAVGYGFLVARGLPRATITHDQLIRTSRAEAQATMSRAMGRRTQRFVLGSSLLLTVVGLITATLTPTWTLWISTMFFAFCSWTSFQALRRTR